MFLVLFICVCLLVANVFLFLSPYVLFYFLIFLLFLCLFFFFLMLSNFFFFESSFSLGFFFFFNCIWNNFNYQLGVIFLWTFGMKRARDDNDGGWIRNGSQKAYLAIMAPYLLNSMCFIHGFITIVGQFLLFKETHQF